MAIDSELQSMVMGGQPNAYVMGKDDEEVIESSPVDPELQALVGVRDMRPGVLGEVEQPFAEARRAARESLLDPEGKVPLDPYTGLPASKRFRLSFLPNVEEKAMALAQDPDVENVFVRDNRVVVRVFDEDGNLVDRPLDEIDWTGKDFVDMAPAVPELVGFAIGSILTHKGLGMLPKAWKTFATVLGGNMAGATADATTREMMRRGQGLEPDMEAARNRGLMNFLIGSTFDLSTLGLGKAVNVAKNRIRGPFSKSLDDVAETAAKATDRLNKKYGLEGEDRLRLSPAEATSNPSLAKMEMWYGNISPGNAVAKMANRQDAAERMFLDRLAGKKTDVDPVAYVKESVIRQVDDLEKGASRLDDMVRDSLRRDTVERLKDAGFAQTSDISTSQVGSNVRNRLNTIYDSRRLNAQKMYEGWEKTVAGLPVDPGTDKIIRQIFKNAPEARYDAFMARYFPEGVPTTVARFRNRLQEIQEDISFGNVAPDISEGTLRKIAGDLDAHLNKSLPKEQLTRKKAIDGWYKDNVVPFRQKGVVELLNDSTRRGVPAVHPGTYVNRLGRNRTTGELGEAAIPQLEFLQKQLGNTSKEWKQLQWSLARDWFTAARLGSGQKLDGRRLAGMIDDLSPEYAKLVFGKKGWRALQIVKRNADQIGARNMGSLRERDVMEILTNTQFKDGDQVSEYLMQRAAVNRRRERIYRDSIISPILNKSDDAIAIELLDPHRVWDSFLHKANARQVKRFIAQAQSEGAEDMVNAIRYQAKMDLLNKASDLKSPQAKLLAIKGMATPIDTRQALKLVRDDEKRYRALFGDFDYDGLMDYLKYRAARESKMLAGQQGAQLASGQLQSHPISTIPRRLKYAATAAAYKSMGDYAGRTYHYDLMSNAQIASILTSSHSFQVISAEAARDPSVMQMMLGLTDTFEPIMKEYYRLKAGVESTEAQEPEDPYWKGP